MHGLLLRGEPFDFVLNALLHISRILVECRCQNEGPSKILGNDAYNTSQNFGIRFQFSYGDIYNIIVFNPS
jgi:hypothetical protein